MNIKKLADSLVRKYNTQNPFEIIDNLNAIVVFYPLQGVRGFYQYFHRNASLAASNCKESQNDVQIQKVMDYYSIKASDLKNNVFV